MKKKMKSKLMAVVVSLAMVFTMMPVIGSPSYAADEYNLWVGGEQVTSDTPSGDGWSYDKDSNTLTLNNAEIEAGYNYATDYIAGIYYNGSETLNIVLEGKNSIILSRDQKASGIYYYGGTIKVSGTGSLSTEVGNAGINATNVTIEGGNITAKGDEGIRANELSVSGGTVTVSGCLVGFSCDTCSVSGGTVDIKSDSWGIQANVVKISNGEVEVTSGIDAGISGRKSVEISGGTVTATGFTAGLATVKGEEDIEDITISGGTVIAKATGNEGDAAAIRSAKHVDIKGGTVEATGTNYGIAAKGQVSITGGSVTASGEKVAINPNPGSGVEIGNRVLVMAGDDKDHASDETETFEQNYAAYKWVHAEKCTLWVGGIPVTSTNAEDILGELDKGVTAKYEEITKTLTLNNYNYESEGYNYDAEHAQYAAIYADQNLTIQFKGDNTVKCTEIKSSDGNGIYVKGDDKNDEGSLVISGSGTLNARGYGYGCGIYARYDDITINGGTVNAYGSSGISTDKKEIKINGGIVTATGTDRGFSGHEVTTADDMGINAGESKETAVDVDKKIFKNNHLQEWVQVSKAYPLWVRGIRVMVANMDDVQGDGKVRFIPAEGNDSASLILKGADIKADSDHQHNGAAICYEGKDDVLTIDAQAASTVTGPEDPEQENYGIYTNGPLAFKGRLTVSGDDFGIFSGGDSTGAVTVSSGADLTAIGVSKGAIDAIVKNYIVGIGWRNAKGTEGKKAVAVNKQGQKLDKGIKKVVFPASAAAVTTKPAAKSPTYNGSAQELVTAGSSSGGIMQYALGADGTNVPEKGWSTSIPKGTDAGDYYVWYKAVGDISHVDSDAAFVKVTIKEKPAPKPDPKPAKQRGKLINKMTAKGKTRLVIGWGKVKGAAGYDIFFARCNHNGKKIVCRNVKRIKGNKIFKWTKSGLKKGTSYKAYVKAYVKKGGKKKYISKSPVMHAYTGNGNKKYTNAKSVSLKNVKKGKLTLKKGKTFKIKAKVKKVKKNKKLFLKNHVPTLRYMTSDKKIATVSSKGKIKAVAKGKCCIYAYAHNGISKKVTVTVKR